MLFNVQSLICTFLLMSIVGVNVIDSLQPGECSSLCRSQQLVEIIGEKTETCSCSPSCSKFGDCCYDSPFRNDDTAKLPKVCLPVDHDLYSAIDSCPPSWSASSEFCLKSTGHLSPVTSLTTGSTYTNIYCAICNDDSSNVTIWDVDFTCCSERESEILQSERDKDTKVGFFFRGYSFWRWVESKAGRFECRCRFKPRNGKSFVPKSTELRPCQTKTFHLHSNCAAHWRDERTRQHCLSYLDPVYVHDRVYKNIHCAMCNFDDISKASCIPGIVSFMQRRNKDMDEIRKFCRKHQMTSCLHYLMSKGRKRAFSELFATSIKECVPPPGRRCCEGWKRDFYSKRCKKITYT